MSFRDTNSCFSFEKKKKKKEERLFTMEISLSANNRSAVYVGPGIGYSLVLYFFIRKCCKFILENGRMSPTLVRLYHSFVIKV